MWHIGAALGIDFDEAALIHRNASRFQAGLIAVGATADSDKNLIGLEDFVFAIHFNGDVVTIFGLLLPFGFCTVHDLHAGLVELSHDDLRAIGIDHARKQRRL